MILSLLITVFVFAQLTPTLLCSGHLCWDFAFSPGNVPESCGDGSVPLDFIGIFLISQVLLFVIILAASSAKAKAISLKFLLVFSKPGR